MALALAAAGVDPVFWGICRSSALLLLLAWQIMWLSGSLWQGTSSIVGSVHRALHKMEEAAAAPLWQCWLSKRASEGGDIPTGCAYRT